MKKLNKTGIKFVGVFIFWLIGVFFIILLSSCTAKSDMEFLGIYSGETRFIQRQLKPETHIRLTNGMYVPYNGFVKTGDSLFYSANGFRWKVIRKNGILLNNQKINENIGVE